MNDYKNVKIANEVILVEKQEEYCSWVTWRKVNGQGLHQGYVVDAGNKKMLENALNWAKCSEYDESLRPTEPPYNWDKYYDSKKVIPGIEHKYQNGQFEITLCDSADGSSQGGKLSFWNCIITCPDGLELLVGINADILLELLLKNTFINGKCQSKVWLGRIKGTQVGAFTENMELFEQAQKDEASRQENKKANSNYVPGDIVKTLKEKDLYLGSAYQYYAFENLRYREDYLIIYDKPKLIHVYKSYYTSWQSDEETLGDWPVIKNTKVKRLVDGHINLTETALEFLKNYNDTKLKEADERDAKNKGCRYSWDYAKDVKMYGESPVVDKEAIIKYLKDEYKKRCYEWASDLEREYKIISESEFEKLKY